MSTPASEPRTGMSAEELRRWGAEFEEKLAETERILEGFEALVAEVFARRENKA